MTPSQKAHDTRVFRFCRNIRDKIAAIPDGCSDREVVALFIAEPGSKRVKADAFHLLDTQPHRFSVGSSCADPWHSRLRSCRNHPTHGPALFATWS